MAPKGDHNSYAQRTTVTRGKGHVQNQHLLAVMDEPLEQWKGVIWGLQHKNARLQAEVMRLVTCVSEREDQMEAVKQLTAQLDHQRAINNKQAFDIMHLHAENQRPSG